MQKSVCLLFHLATVSISQAIHPTSPPGVSTDNQSSLPSYITHQLAPKI